MLNTNDSSSTADRFWLNSFEVVPNQHLIVHKGEETSINPRTMGVLMCLVEHQGEYLSTQELFDQIWPANHVSDNSVYKAINELRVVFGDTAEKPRFIESRPRRGYRLIVVSNSDGPVAGLIFASRRNRHWRVWGLLSLMM